MYLSKKNRTLYAIWGELSKTNLPTRKYMLCYRYPDGRISISMHPFKPSTKEKKKNEKTPDKDSSSYMTIANYERQLKTAYKKLWNREYNLSRCYFITLTIKDFLNETKLQYHFRRFLESVEYRYGNVEYMRVFEYQEETNLLHIHAILDFTFCSKEDEPLLTFNTKTVEGLWKLGICKVETMNNIYSVIQYLTKFKCANIPLNDVIDPLTHRKKRVLDRFHTKFKKGTKLVSISRNFGKSISIEQCEKISISKKQAYALINLYLNNENQFVRIDGHYYDYPDNKNPLYCMDNVYLHSPFRISKNAIDKILANG